MSSIKSYLTEDSLAPGIGGRLRELREHHELTQEEFGERVGFAAYKIRDIERDHIKLSARDAHEIALTYGASDDWLWMNKGEMLVADRHRRKMMANIVAEGLITSDEIDVLLYLRSIGITSKTKLLRALTADDIAKTVEFAVGERRTKYVEKTNKRKE